MFKRIKTLIMGLIAFCVAFTFFPTGSSGSQVVSGFKQQSASYSTNQSFTAQTFLSVRDAIIAGDEEYVDNFTGGLRKQITQFAIQTAKDFGNGYYADPNAKGTAQENGKKIFYRSQNACKFANCDHDTDTLLHETYGPEWLYGDYGYARFDLALNNFNAIKADKSHMHFSCHGASTFCWKYIWKNAPYYVHVSGCPDYIYSHKDEGPGKLSTAVAGIGDIRENAKPGDIIWNNNPDKKSAFAHSTLWLGDVTIDGVEIKDACMNCGSGNNYNDWVIKPFIMSDKKNYYLVSLRDVVVEVEKSDDGYEVQEWIDMDISGMPLDEVDESEN